MNDPALPADPARSPGHGSSGTLPVFRFAIIYSVFILSGATALVYQIIWSRWLGLVFGNTTTSISVVLGSFMMGLAVGSWLAGTFLDRIGSPLKIYALMELGIGLFALYFAPLTGLVEKIFFVLVSAESPAAYAVLVKTLSSSLLLIIPTTLMGATLPLLTEYFRRSPRHSSGWKVGYLYAANTFGAAAGTFAVGFFLIELLGVRVTTFIAADVNIVIAVVAFFAAGRPELRGRERDAFGRAPGPGGHLALWALAVSGAAALASEVLWTRTIESLIGNSTYAFAAIVIVYLVGIAAGSWLMSLVVKRLGRHVLWLAGMLVGMGIWTLVAVRLFGSIADILGQYRGQVIPLSIILLGYLKATAILIPLAALSGACFPLATRIIDPVCRDARGVLIARAYAWNTVGALAGSFIAGFLIAPLFDYLNALSIVAGIYGLSALAVIGAVNRPAIGQVLRQPATLALGTLSLALCLAAAAHLNDRDYYKTRLEAKFPGLEVVYHRPGLQGVTTVLKDKRAGLASMLLVNGMGMTTKITDTKMMAHLPMLFHQDPRDTLVICFGMGTTYRSAISYGRNVTVVELVREVLETFDYFYADAERVRAYPRGKAIVNDGRNFLQLTTDRYDVITVDPPPPIDAAGVNHLYSREFIELVKSRLKEGGIVAHWIPFPGRMAGVEDWQTFNMLVATFMDAFPYSYGQIGFNRVGLHVLGSMRPLSVRRSELSRRAGVDSVRKDLMEWDFIPEAYLLGVQPLTGDTTLVPRITDDRPRLEFYLLTTLREGGRKMHAYSYW